jgi:sugar-specific transcriptional regulator TrmB
VARIDLTQFGFTPTESLVYEVLLSNGPGTGYAIARAAGLARANAYSALEGLVAKGAARVDAGRPRQYRAEPPAGLIARISNNHGQALERLATQLQEFGAPEAPTMVEIESARAVLQQITRDLAQASRSVGLLAPPDAFPLLAPALTRPVSAELTVQLWSTAPVTLELSPVKVISGDHEWPGMPIISVVDDRSALIGARRGNEVHGYWSTAPAFVAAARLTLERISQGS